MRSLLIASTLLLSFNSFAFNDFEKALTSYNKNDVDEAYIHLKNVLKDDSDNLPATVLMGRVLLRKNLYMEGIEVLQDALFRGADINFLINDLTSALMITNSYDEVIKLSINKNLTAASQLTTYLLSGNAYTAMEDAANAEIYYKKAYSIEPEDLRTISALAAFHIQQQNNVEAAPLIKKGLRLFASDSRVWNLKGQLHDNKSEYELAFKAYESGFKVNPDDPFIQRALANAYANAKQPEKALSLVESILKDTPTDPFAKLLKSRLLASTSREEEANQILVDISQKLSLLTEEEKHTNASLALVAGTSAYLQNNLELAQKELQFYVRETPQDLSGISLLVDIYLSQGQQEKALELLENKNKFIKNNLNLSLKLFDLYLSNNKIYKAEQVLEPLETSYGKHLQYILGKANLLTKTNQYSEALELLKANKPERFSAAYFLTKGLILKANNQTKEAHKIADKLLTLNPKNVDYLAFKGALYLKQQQWQESINTYSKILKQQPNNYSSLFNTSTALAAMGKHNEAIKITSKLLEQQPNNISLQILNAKINRDLGNIDIAKKALKNIIDKSSTNIAALETLMELNYREKNFTEALEQADRLGKLSFLNATYIEKKAQIYIGLNDNENAKKQLRLLGGIFTSPREIYRLSKMQSQANDFAGAKKSLHKALSIDPENKVLQLTLTRLEIDLGNYDAAQSHLVKLEEKHPVDPNVLMLRGDYYLKLQDPIQAQVSYLNALKIDNNFHIVLLKLNKLALSKIGEDEFESSLTSMLTANPKNHLMRTVLADYLLINGRAEEAKPHYERLVTVEKLLNKSSVLNNLANIYISIDLKKAEEYSKKSLELGGSSSAILDTYGWILSLNGKFDESLTILRKAYSMNSSDPAINYHIGYTLMKLDRKDEAKRELMRAVRHKTSFSERDNAQALLNSIK
jgi:tetratricopeptide (TPR) repeat protein